MSTARGRSAEAVAYVRALWSVGGPLASVSPHARGSNLRSMATTATCGSTAYERLSLAV